MKGRSRFLIIGLLALVFVLSGQPVLAQQAKATFGKNRIQYKSFNWRYYSSENFDIYFYDEGAVLSREVLSYLEDEFDRVTDFLGYYPYSKTKIFVYNSITDLQQSNIGVNSNQYNVGGQTNFVKSHIEVANPGTVTGLKQELLLQISRLYINEMMFGGSLTDMFQSTYLLNLPQWFTEGAAYYVARGWDVEMDDFMRDIITTNRVKRLNQFTDYEANIVGQSVWNFIAENYGRSNISNILNLTRIIRNEEKSIANTLGLPFKQVSVEWQNYYAGMAAQVRNNYVKPPEETRLYKNNSKRNKFTELSLSPDGTKLAYAENENGRYAVIVRDLESGNEEKILGGGYRVIDQEVDYNIPLISWADEKTLGIVEMEKGQTIMWLYDLETESKLPKNLRRFNQVHSIDFSQNGRLAVISADIRGQNDIYLVSIRRERVKRLTNDAFDDLYPRFIPGTNTVVFSSNRDSDSLNVKVDDIGAISRDNYNLFYYNLDTTKTVVRRITNTISKDYAPIPASQSQLFYLSDQKGITNLFKYSSADSLYTQITNYSLSLQDYDIDFLTNTLAYVVNVDGRDFIHVEPNFNFNRNIFTIQTMRQQVMQAKMISDRRKNKILDTRSDPIQLSIPDRRKKNEEPEKKKPDPDFIDTDNYIFDAEVSGDDEEEQPTNNVSFLMQYRQLEAEQKVVGPFPYETRFSADNLITSWVIDPIRGFGILLETQMNDMLENHRFYGGIMATTDLRSGDIYAEYQYLKTQIDYSVRIDRKVIFWNKDNAIQKYALNKIEVGASLPLTVKSRISFKPFYAFKNFENLDPNLLTSAPPPITDNSKVNYVGFTGELVYDNSISKGLNLYQGTRGKLGFTTYNGLGMSEESFSKFTLDLRNYQKIHREVVFATRLFYGRFFGNKRQDFLLGGMDNWLFNKTNTTGVGNPLSVNGELDNSDLLFTDFVTSLRGFDYATLFGTNALLFNAEFRLPIVKYFYRGPISSNFFRNLQLIGFYDLGSSWTGSSPLSTENSVNTEVITQGVWQAEIKNFRNPWLQSYGFGLRTVLLGYYMKFDLAWPIEDYDVGKPRLHVTLGLDF